MWGGEYKSVSRLNQQVNLTEDNLELQWSQRRTFNLDKLIHLWGALQIKGSQLSTDQQGWGNFIFLLYSFWWSGWHPVGHRTCSRAHRKLAELSVRALNKIRSLSLVPGWERKVKFHTAPSFSNSDWQEKSLVRINLWIVTINLPSGTHCCLFFLCRDSECLFVCLILCPENLVWQLSGWEPQQYAWIEM